RAVGGHAVNSAVTGVAEELVDGAPLAQLVAAAAGELVLEVLHVPIAEGDVAAVLVRRVPVRPAGRAAPVAVRPPGEVAGAAVPAGLAEELAVRRGVHGRDRE